MSYFRETWNNLLYQSIEAKCENSVAMRHDSSSVTNADTSDTPSEPLPSRSAQGQFEPVASRQFTKPCTSTPSRAPSRFMSPGSAQTSPTPGQNPPVSE